MPDRSKQIETAKTRTRAGTRMSVQAVSMYQGPIPPALELKKYEDVLPGSADRILKMAEKQADHRRAMEKEMLTASVKQAQMGQVFSFCIFALTLVAGFVLMWLGKDAIGLITSLAAIAGLMGIFRADQKAKQQELAQKNEELETGNNR